MPVFYDFSGRDQRARNFSREVNAKTESLPAETGQLESLHKPRQF